MHVQFLKHVIVLLGAAAVTFTPVASAQSEAGRADSSSAISDRDNDTRRMRDGRLADRIEVKFAQRRSFSRSDIDVSANNRTVTLTGKVDSENQKQRAERLARSTPGVEEVNNQLTVDANLSNQTEEVPDDRLSKNVAERLADELPFAEADEDWIYGWEVNGANWDFDVDADEGDISLEGEVGSYGQYLSAVRAARDVPGVRSVDSSDLEIDNDYGLYDPFDYGYWDYAWDGY